MDGACLLHVQETILQRWCFKLQTWRLQTVSVVALNLLHCLATMFHPVSLLVSVRLPFNGGDGHCGLTTLVSPPPLLLLLLPVCFQLLLGALWALILLSGISVSPWPFYFSRKPASSPFVLSILLLCHLYSCDLVLLCLSGLSCGSCPVPRCGTFVISVIALPGESLVAGGASEAVVICVGLLMLEHVSPAAECLLTEKTLVGFDTWRREDFIRINVIMLFVSGGRNWLLQLKMLFLSLNLISWLCKHTLKELQSSLSYIQKQVFHPTATFPHHLNI